MEECFMVAYDLKSSRNAVHEKDMVIYIILISKEKLL